MPDELELLSPELRERIDKFITEVGEQAVWIVLNLRALHIPLNTREQAPPPSTVDPRLFESTAMLLHLAAQALKERA